MESGSLNVDIEKFLPYGDPYDGAPFNCSETLMKMLLEGLHADIVLEARGGSVKAHRSVLATCSPVFRAMFRHAMQEQLTSCVEMLDMTLDGLQVFLLFIYGPNCDAEPDELPAFDDALDRHFDEVFQACQKYQVFRLDKFLTTALKRNLTPENWWDYYHRIMSSSQPMYRGFLCREYLAENYDQVMASESVLFAMQQDAERVQTFIVSHTASKPPALELPSTGSQDDGSS